MTDINELLSVTLPGRPTCKDCISWSEDDIAVASGEFIHILTPKNWLSRPEAAGHSFWQITSPRVNLFRQDEWTDQTLATIDDFSIGEEQSTSFVVALAWSNAGVGMHRRSVLGILTSNLLLSLWETDGTQSKFQRTCIVNDYINNHDPDHPGDNVNRRRALRIRCFAWLPLLQTSSSSKWGSHLLVAVDDNNIVSLLQVSKTKTVSLGHWNFKVKLQVRLNELSCTSLPSQAISPMQKRLYHQSPATKIAVGTWSQPNAHIQHREQALADERSTKSYLANLTATRGAANYSAKICASVDNLTQQTTFTIIDNSHGGANSSLDHIQDEPLSHVSVLNKNDDWISASVSPETFFDKTVKPIRDDFNRTFQLYGHLITRFWGMAISKDNNKIAACVTLHPSDMIEYVIPSTEKCYIVFENRATTETSVPARIRPAISAQQEILRFACTLVNDNAHIESILDKKLLYVFVRLAGLIFDHASEVRTTLNNRFKSIMSDAILQDVTNSNSDQPPETPQEDLESCEICGASIHFTADTTNCACSSGHLFSRCQLSFLAIQEPAISKYCSRCGMQFLDLTKLGASTGPSLSQAVFDEFDVCPYCQAKFRG